MRRSLFRAFEIEKGIGALRILTILFAVSAVADVFAFDSSEWLARKEVLMREAERLQGVYTSCVARVEKPAENVSVPVDSHPDGSIKTLITASRAQYFIDDAVIWAKNVLAKDFDPSGVNRSSLFAENCVVDRETKSGWVEGAARARHGTTDVSGSRVYVSFAENFVMIFSGASVRSDDMRKPGEERRNDIVKRRQGAGGFSSSNSTVTVQSEKADYDRAAGVIMMDGCVRFNDDEYSLAADRAWVFLSGTNELRRVVAIGSVAVTNGLRRGYCDRVLYERRSGKITMYGRSAKEPAHLIDSGPDGGELEGSRICFRTDAEQVEVDDPVITVRTDARGAGDFFTKEGK